MHLWTSAFIGPWKSCFRYSQVHISNFTMDLKLVHRTNIKFCVTLSSRIIMRADYSPVTKWHSVQVQRQCVMSGACHFIITCHWILPSSVSLSVQSSSVHKQNEMCPVPSCALTQQIEKAGDFWQEQLNLHSPPAPHTRFSLFIFILFIYFPL